MSRQNGGRPIALMAACAVLWSTAGLFIKMIPWNPIVIAGWRSLIASGVVVLYMAARRVRPVLNRRSLMPGVMLCLTFLTFVSANKLTTSANAIVLQYTAPIFIMLISALAYGQKFRRADYWAVAATFGGVALCFLDELSAGSLLGNGIAVLAGVFFAGMYVAGGRADARERMSGILLGHLFTAAVGLTAMIWFPPAFSGRAMGYMVLLGVFQLGVAYVLYGIAAEGCTPLVACLVSVLEPLLNPVWVFLFDGEAPGPMALVGGVIAVTAITLWCVWDARRQSTAISA